MLLNKAFALRAKRPVGERSRCFLLQTRARTLLARFAGLERGLRSAHALDTERDDFGGEFDRALRGGDMFLRGFDSGLALAGPHGTCSGALAFE